VGSGSKSTLILNTVYGGRCVQLQAPAPIKAFVSTEVQAGYVPEQTMLRTEITLSGLEIRSSGQYGPIWYKF
jgi:hypothetical protein